MPDRIAGLTGGLVSTAQQAAFALGVATLGTGYTALAGGMPAQHALAVVLVVHAGLAAAFAGCARSLHRAPSTDGTEPRVPAAAVRSRR